MAAVNNAPIYSKVGDIQGYPVLSATATTDYLGQHIQVAQVFIADATNGGYLQRLRFKALGTNVASVARVYVNNGLGNLVYAATATASTGITGTGSSSGGVLQSGTNYFAKIVAVDQYGVPSLASVEGVTTVVTGPSGSISWAFATVTDAASYNIYVGPVTGGQQSFFSGITGSPFVQTMAVGTRGSVPAGLYNSALFGEVSLPITTATASTNTVDVDYPMNLALPPGYRVLVGLGTACAAGWQICGIGGKF